MTDQPTATQALAEAPATASRLRRIAAAPIETAGPGWATERLRLDGVPTSTYRTRAVGSAGSGAMLRDAAAVQFHAAGLDSQPWYDAFLGGSIIERLDPGGHDLLAAHTSVGRFCITRKIERTYHQLQTLSGDQDQGYVVTLRSIAPPADSLKTALTLPPSGEVFTVDAEGRLVWDHIVTASGAALLPERFDGWVTEATRRFGLDKAERATYQAEATEWIALLADAQGWTSLVRAAGMLEVDVDSRGQARVTEHEMLQLAADEPAALGDAYAARGWGDGLPMIPPTPGRVDAMLAHLEEVAGRALDHDEPVAVLPPRSGQATRRMLAVNAVLAGCAPEQLPVVITAIRALARPEVNLCGVNATTHPVAPLVVVHGEIATSVGYNAGLGAFGPGNRANATTGRAVRLALAHIGGATPPDGDASTQGGPAKYTYCVAENTAESPWEGFAPSRGVDAASAVTVHCGEAPHNAHDMESAHPTDILDKVASAMCSTGQNNAPISSAEYFVMLCPEHAAACAGAGWSRHHVADYLFQRARMPAGELRRAFELRAWAPWLQQLADDELAPMTERATNIAVMVVGGAGKHSSVIPSWGMTASVTMEVTP